MCGGHFGQCAQSVLNSGLHVDVSHGPLQTGTEEEIYVKLTLKVSSAHQVCRFQFSTPVCAIFPLIS